MKAYPKTRTGGKMKLGLREKILETMADKENDGKPQKELAKLIGITDKTLRNYLTLELWQEIKERRLRVMFTTLDAVDEVMFTKALKGDTQAAKMIYARWAEKQAYEMEQQPEDVPEEMSELDKEIEEIREQIRNIEGPKGEKQGSVAEEVGGKPEKPSGELLPQ